MDYVNLHNHTYFSLLDGAADPKKLAKLAADNKAKALAMTDHGSASGWLKHKKACEEVGIQPLYGVELYLAEEFDRIHEEGFKFKNLHLTCIAKNQTGFEKILKGLNYANKYGTGKSGRNKRAFVPINYPLQHWVGDVVVLSGCHSSPFYNLEKQSGEEFFKQYADAFKDDFYGELMPLHDFPDQIELNKKAYQYSIQNGKKFVVTNDIHYCHKEDWQLHELVLCLGQKGMTWNNEHRWKFSTHLNYYRTGEDMYGSLMAMGLGDEISRNGIITTNEIAEKCSFKLQSYPMDLINPLNDSENEVVYFKQACMSGMHTRGTQNIPVYEERLNKEIEMIEQKKFVRYMLMVADVIRWAKSQGILIGPGRGSAAGSLVSYVLGITDVDPIKHGLHFERFISPDRVTIPDIDIDVADKERELVEQYLKEKYGADNVAHVGTYQYMYGKSSLRDVGRVYEVPLGEVDTAAKMLVKKPISDVREFRVIEDTLKEVPEFSNFANKYPEVVVNASKLEGQLKNTGIHAAGFVISNGKLHESERCYLIDGNDGKKAVNWDKEDLEFFGYVKLDLLGLNTLTVLGETLKLIKEKQGKVIELNKLELYDKETYAAIGKGETATAFQINTPAFTSYCKQLQPDIFDDVAALTALWRPGPIGAGQAKDYVDSRHGRYEQSFLCNEYDSIVRETRGQLIYQEQVTKLLTDLAGFSYIEADKVRKIIAKSEGVQKIKDYLPKFVSGCKSKGTITEEQAVKLWTSMYEFGRYSFNKSHATAYGLMTYWTMYLKTHYPTEYLCAYLNYGSTDKENSDGETNLDSALRECRRLGIQILRPDINESNDGWTVVGHKKLRAGLKEIVGVGDKAKQGLMVAKATCGTIKSFDQLLQSVERRAVNRKVIHCLLFTDALNSLEGSDVWKRNFEQLYDTYGKKKFNELYEKSKQLPIAEIDHKDLLNYSEKAITELDDAGKSMAKNLGLSYIDNDIPSLSDGNNFWPVIEARRGVLNGLNLSLIKKQLVDKEAYNSLIKKTKECKECDLRLTCTAPVPHLIGKYNVAIVAEAPGYYEDRDGEPLKGKAGKYLWTALADLGFNRSDFFVDNTVHCRPINNVLLSNKYIDKCEHLTSMLKLVKPKLILALGNKPLYYFKKKESGIMAMSGITEWHNDLEAFVCYCVHPSSAMREDSRNMADLFQKGMYEFQRMFVSLGGKI